VKRLAIRSFLCTAALFTATAVGAQEAAPPGDGAAGSQQLAKQLANPVASLVSIPLQYNWEQGVGPGNDTRFILNFQPVVPLSLNEDWNLIGRLIMPMVSQPALFPGGEATFGISDVLLSAFFSPAKPSAFIWGVGPVLSLPSTSEPTLGSGQWSAGPTFVVLKQQGAVTVGALANHLWSFAGDDARSDVNQTFLQPFLAYTTPTAVTFTLSSESTANWEAASGQKWTVPINVQVSKVVRIGPFPASLGFGGGYFVEKPTNGPEWKLRATATILLPRGR
jgi:hypothetical protein